MTEMNKDLKGVSYLVNSQLKWSIISTFSEV